MPVFYTFLKGSYIVCYFLLVDPYEIAFNAFFFFGLFCLFRAIPVAYGGSQARGLIEAVAASLFKSHSNARSEPSLRPTP